MGGYQRSGRVSRDSAVRHARQWPQVTIRSGLLGSPHSGQSTVPGEPAPTSSARAAWTSRSPAQGQPRCASVQPAVSLEMARLLVST